MEEEEEGKEPMEEEEEGKEPIIQFLKKSFLAVLMSQISKDDFLKIKNRESPCISKRKDMPSESLL